MKTVNSLIRTANASYKRADREKIKNLNEAAKYQQQELKDQIKNGNLTAVVTYHRYVDLLLSVHEESCEALNWDIFSREPEPRLPNRECVHQEAAEHNYRNFIPSFFDRLLGQSRKKLRELSKRIEAAKQVDDIAYNNTLKEFKMDLQDWTKIQAIRKGIKDADPGAYKLAIDFFDPFARITQFGSQLQLEIYADRIIVNIYINEDDFIPDYILSKTSSGKLSMEKMPVIAYHELYQDYICSCVLRIARETFALLPVKCSIVNVFADLEDKTTGCKTAQAILSVNFNPDSLRMLHFKALDCPGALINFPHEMKFSTIGGFLPVEVLSGNNSLLSLK